MAESTRIGSQLKALRSARLDPKPTWPKKPGSSARPSALTRKDGQSPAWPPWSAWPTPSTSRWTPSSSGCRASPGTGPARAADSRGPGHRSRTHLRSQHQGGSRLCRRVRTRRVAELPTFDLPLPGVPRDRTLRFFQIEGDSMLPIPSGSWILCTYVERMEDVGSGKEPYIVATRDDGLLFKHGSKTGWTSKATSGWSPTIRASPPTRWTRLRCAKPGAQSAGFPPIGRAERQPPGEPRPRKSENGRPKSRLHKPIECNHLQIQYPIIGFCRFPALSSTL